MSGSRRWMRIALLGGWIFFASEAALSIEAGQLDGFQDGTTQGWVANPGGGIGIDPPFPPALAPDAGPNGLGDDALRVTGTGIAFMPGSRIVANNIRLEWTGDYTAAAIEGIMVDVNNLNAVPLTIRVGLNQPVGVFTGGRFVSAGIQVPASSGWMTLFFPIEADDLLPGDPSAVDPATTLADVGLLRILHADGNSFMGDTFAGQLDIDNVEAVPEPAIPVALSAGAAVLWLLRNRRRRS